MDVTPIPSTWKAAHTVDGGVFIALYAEHPQKPGHIAVSSVIIASPEDLADPERLAVYLTQITRDIERLRT